VKISRSFSSKLNKPLRGIFEKKDLAAMKYLREVRLTPEEVEARLERGSFFLRQILEQGKVLYEREP
jgi:hypothetical protein